MNKSPSALRGPARILTRAVLTAVHTLYTTDPDLYLDEIVLWLAIHHNISISVSALQQSLTKAGLTRKILHKIALERDEVLRQQWSDMQASDDFLPSDVPAWPGSHRPCSAWPGSGQARPGQRSALAGPWLWLEFLEATGHGLGHGFGWQSLHLFPWRFNIIVL